MKLKLKNYVYALGLGGLGGATCTLLYTFLIAYFNGYSVIININNYGEAHIELVLFIFLLPFMVYVLFNSIDNLIKVQNENP